MAETLVSLAALVAMGLASLGIGRPLLRLLGPTVDDPLADVTWSMALGLVAAGSGLALLGLIGYSVIVISVLTAVAAFWGIGEALHVARPQHGLFGAPRIRPEADAALQAAAPPPWFVAAIKLLAAAACGTALISALAPPTAGDALCYHLELPKRFLLEGRLIFLPDSDNATFPLLVEMWFLWALALDGGVAAQLVHWGLGVGFVVATALLARPILGTRWSTVAGCLVALVPGVNNQMTAPLNDIGLAALTTLCLAAWWRAAVVGESPRWYLVAGVMLGGAMATKYVGLVFAMALGATGLLRAWRATPDQRRAMVVGAGAMAALAICVSGTWYARAAWYRGNPVYPFLSEYVGEPGPPTQVDAKAPLGYGPAGMLVAPWALTMSPERLGGRGHQLGPLFLMALPALVFARRLRGIATLGTFAALYAVAWLELRQNSRFLLPIVPPLAIAVAWAWHEVRRLPPAPRGVIVLATMAAMMVSAVVPVWRCRGAWGVACGLESRPEFLFREEPTFATSQLTRDVLGRDVHILSQDHRGYYFNARFTRESIYRRRTAYDHGMHAPGDLSRRLREAGFTHLLLAELEGDNGTAYDPTLTRLAEAELSSPDSGLLTLSDLHWAERDGRQRRYRLLMVR